MSRRNDKKHLAKFYIDKNKFKNPKNLMYNRAEVELGAPIMASRAHYTSVVSFLREVERLKPAVLSDLKKIREEYTENVRQQFLAADLLYNLGHLWWVLVQSEDNDCTEFGASLLNWAFRHNLSDVENAWIVGYPLYLNIAIACITGCIQNGQRHEFDAPESLGDRELSLVGSVGYWMPESPEMGKRPFEFLVPGHVLEWGPYESWEEFEERLDTIYGRHKAAYKMAMESFFEAKNYNWAPEKRVDYHYTWLVQWQLLGWTQAKITKEHSKIHRPLESESAVSKKLPEVAQRVRIPLRAEK